MAGTDYPIGWPVKAAFEWLRVGRRHRPAAASSLDRAGAPRRSHRSDETRPGGDGTELRALGCEHVIARCDTSSARALPPAYETT